ncbi:MAG: hypothetical protein R3A46_11880 [Thermomicrobiales bacterium]
MDLDMTDARTRTRIGIGVVALQWLLLTFALGVMIIYTDQSLNGLIGLHLDSGYAFVGATIIGFLMGATVERTKALVPMVALCCLGGSAVYVALLFFPVWTGKLVQTVGLENFASTRALLYFGLSIVPVSLGAMTGRLVGSLVPGGDLLRRRRDDARDNWWLARSEAKDGKRETIETR